MEIERSLEAAKCGATNSEKSIEQRNNASSQINFDLNKHISKYHKQIVWFLWKLFRNYEVTVRV
jgi:hypothetical protein